MALPLPTNPSRLTKQPAWEWLNSLTLTEKGLFLSPILVQPKIFISCLHSAGKEELLKSEQITHVFSFAQQPNEIYSYPNKELSGLPGLEISSPNSVYTKLGIKRYLFQLQDNDKNSDSQIQTAFQCFEELCRENYHQNILIHCQLGASRSVSFVAALIAKSENWSFKKAVLEIRKHREVGIDQGFAEHLCRILRITFE